MTPHEIVSLTPKTNCGQCGYPACLAFAANVARSGENPAKCPYLDTTALSYDRSEKVGLEELGKKHDLELINNLKEKISRLDLSSLAEKLGASIPPAQADSLNFRYLGHDVLLNHDHILIDNREPDDPRDQILLYNYVHSGGGAPLENIWTGLESLPNSISKVRTLAVYCEEKLARHFSDLNHLTITNQAALVDGEACLAESADISLHIKVLPKIHQKILFWEEDKEEGFGARVKILYDAGVLNYLDLESLVFSSERMAEKLSAANPP